jgi:integrase
MTNAINGTDLPSEALQSPTLELSDILRHYARRSLAENTWRTYRSQWRQFVTWCSARGTVALPAKPEVVAQYLAERAQGGTAVASLEVALAALRFAHLAAGLTFCVENPTLMLVMNGIRRQHLRPQRQAEPLTGKLLRELLSHAEETPEDLRNGTLLAMLYVFGLRASEVVALDWLELGQGRGWLRVLHDRAEVTLLGSKAVQSRAERVIVPTADNPLAIAVIDRWVALARIASGEPLLRAVRMGGGIGPNRMHTGNIGSAVKRAMARHFQKIGVPADTALLQASLFSGHSGRVGMYVSASEAGVAPQSVAALARHVSLAVARRYAERADMLKCAPHRAAGVGV